MSLCMPSHFVRFAYGKKNHIFSRRLKLLSDCGESDLSKKKTPNPLLNTVAPLKWKV